MIVQGLPLTQEVKRDPACPHVLLVLDQFGKTLGGGERIVLRLAQLLPAYGFRASVLTFSLHPESPVVNTNYPFPIYHLPLDRTWDLTALRAAFALRRFLRNSQVQLVQTFFESSDLWAGLVTKTLSPARLVWSRRDMGILRAPKHRLLYRLLRRLPDAVFAVSDQVRRHAIEVDGIATARVETIYNGLDLAAWPGPHWTQADPQPVGALRSGEPFQVTTVGNIRPVKGHDLFLQAAAIVAQELSDARFSIAGEVLDAAWYAQLQAQVRALGLTEVLQFLGGLTSGAGQGDEAVSTLQQHLAAADLFVLPSRSEGFSNAILEAMAAGLPVIATGVGGNAEAVVDGATGIMIPPEDHAALARAILSLARDGATTTHMGRAGRALAEAKFSEHAMMQATTAAYARLLYGSARDQAATSSP